MRKHLYSAAAGLAMASLAAMCLVGCGTKKAASETAARQETTVLSPEKSLPEVASNPGFITILEVAEAVINPGKLDEVARKYGYKTVENYEVSRLGTYEKMLYKNCILGKSLGHGTYADTPRALKKGTSSYVATAHETVIVGVFNLAAYQNLLNQLQAAGYRLASKGYEDRYTNGMIDAYCYAERKTIRLQRAQP